MRVTQALKIAVGGPDGWWTRPLIFGFGKGLWGPRKMRYTFKKQFRKHLIANTPLKVVETDAKEFLPQGVKVYDALTVAREDFHPPINNVQFPWPFEVKGEIGSVSDPEYREVGALLYSRNMTLYEGMKGAMNFTNSILQEVNTLPSILKEYEQQIDLKHEWIHVLNQRLHWITRNDSSLIKLPRTSFPMHLKSRPRDYGNHPLRRETNVLRAFHEVALKVASLESGRYIDTRMVESPYCVIPFQRDKELVVMNLKSDFMTICHQATVRSPLTGSDRSPVTSEEDERKESGRGRMSAEDGGSKERERRVVTHSLPLFCRDPMSTVSRSLDDIHPVDWRINFDETNFYPTNYGFSLPSNCRVHTLFLSNNSQVLKLQPDRMVQARTLLYLYGITVAQARKLYALPNDFTHPSNYLPIIDSGPITAQGVYYNQTKNNLGFICFQLNTLAFESKVKNQVWSDGPYDIVEDQEIILKKLIAMEAAKSETPVSVN